MEYNRTYGCHNRCFSRPELEIGSRLEVVVIGKSWDNYVIKSSQNGADYFGMIYLGRWIREPQPPYSSRGSDLQQRSIFGAYSNGTIPYSPANKIVRQKEVIESQQQRFAELSNGCEKQTINHGAPQTSLLPAASTVQMSVLKKNKRKAYVPREVPSSFTATPSSSCQGDQRDDAAKTLQSHFQDFFDIANGGHEVNGNDDFTRMLMRYVLKDEKGVGCNNANDPNLNSEQITFDECLRLDQAKKVLTAQKRNLVKRKDSSSVDIQQNMQNCLSARKNGTLHNLKSGTKTLVAQNGTQSLGPHISEIASVAPAAGTANFVNVIPLNIASENRSSEERDFAAATSVTSSDPIASLLTAMSNSAAVINSSVTTAASPTSTSVSVATSTPSRAITPVPASGCAVASSSTPKSDTNANSLSTLTSTLTPPSAILSASSSTPPSPTVNGAEGLATAPDGFPPSTASNSPLSPPSIAEGVETETSSKSVTRAEESDGARTRSSLKSQSGAEQLATLLGCPSLAAKAREATADGASKTIDKQKTVESSKENSVTPQPSISKNEKDGEEVKSEVTSKIAKDENNSTKKNNQNRKIVVKISLGNFPHSTMETKSSTVSSSVGSGRRSVADLRCPPEIAKSFEEQDVIRRSDAGCPPMVPRTMLGYDNVGLNAGNEEKEKKKKKAGSKKKKVEDTDEKEPEKEKVIELSPRGVTEPPPDAPTAEENPFNLAAGDIVWAKNGSEPFWPGELFQFTRVNDVAGAVITWFGVDTFTPFVPLTRIEPFALKYSQRFNPKRNDRKYQKGVARGIYRCKPRSGYFENNMTKCIHEVLVNNYNFVLEPFEGTKKRKRKSNGFAVKKRRTVSSANHSAHFDTQSDELAAPQEEEDHFDDDESMSVEGSNGAPEADGDSEQVEASSCEQNLDETNSECKFPSHKSEDLSRTSPRSPSL